jgi:hypothetical protein
MRKLLTLLAVTVAPLMLAAGDAPPKAPEWTDDLDKMKFPDAPASGKIMGQDFTVEKVELKNTHLELRKGKDFFPDSALLIFLFLKPKESLEDKKWEIPADGKIVVGRPHIHTQARGPGDKVPKGPTPRNTR